MMSPFRYTFVRVLFGGECFIFVWLYVHGGNGMQEMWRLQKENDLLNRGKNEVAVQVAKLEAEYASWDTQSLAKERIARETLHMARPGDSVYYWS